MEDQWDLYGKQTDRWGYTRYSLVVHAPPAIAGEVMQFRSAIGMGDLTSEPHVSLLSHLYSPRDLPDLMNRLQRLLETMNPVTLVFASRRVEQWSAGGGGLSLVPTSSLLALREALVGAVDGAIDGLRSRFEPHLTVYQEATPEEAQRAGQLATTFKFPEGFEIDAIDLVGRIGPPRGGQRQVIRSFGV